MVQHKKSDSKEEHKSDDAPGAGEKIRLSSPTPVLATLSPVRSQAATDLITRTRATSSAHPGPAAVGVPTMLAIPTHAADPDTASRGRHVTAADIHRAVWAAFGPSIALLQEQQEKKEETHLTSAELHEAQLRQRDTEQKSSDENSATSASQVPAEEDLPYELYLRRSSAWSSMKPLAQNAEPIKAQTLQEEEIVIVWKLDKENSNLIDYAALRNLLVSPKEPVIKSAAAELDSSLAGCFRAWGKKEQLGEEDKWYCSKYVFTDSHHCRPLPLTAVCTNASGARLLSEPTSS